MLKRITISNLALIKVSEIEFVPELNVFSGETGAGKSIVVDSLMLLVGGRYDKSLLKFGEESGFVEGVFDFTDATPLLAAGIDCEDGIIIVSRKFYRDGRNDIRVNGKQMTTAMLRELMQSFVDIYGQNEYQSLLKVGEQRKLLDFFIFKNNDAPLKKQRELYDEYKRLVKDMQALGDETARAQRIDILSYQIDEIKSAAVLPDEEQSLIDRRRVLMASERIKNALADCVARLDGENCAGDSVSDCMRALSSISSFGEVYTQLHDRLKSVSIELDDICECVKDELDGMAGGERELDDITARLDKLRSLKSKYGAYDAMQKFLTNAQKELDNAQNGAELYADMCKREKQLRETLVNSCKKLSELRRAGAVVMRDKILAELNELGMANSAFETVFAPIPEGDDVINRITATGFDEFEFYLSPNIGQPLLPLAKIISGGEMSRFMLAVKLITGDLSNIGTMIFDEIDTGISGAIGLCVAKKLAKLSRGHQVLCVTHLPQIAAMADGHYYIEKSENSGDTITKVTSLDRVGMIGEVSRLSGTRGVSTSSDKNAAELKDWSDKFKSEL